MTSTLYATTWMTGFTAGTTTTDPIPDQPAEFREGFQYGRAGKLGDLHGAELMRPFDHPDGGHDMELLLLALDEDDPASPDNADHRIALVNAYGTAWDVRSRKA